MRIKPGKLGTDLNIGKLEGARGRIESTVSDLSLRCLAPGAGQAEPQRLGGIHRALIASPFGTSFADSNWAGGAIL